jgi:glycine cleavage system aminomethyltransferase T
MQGPAAPTVLARLVDGADKEIVQNMRFMTGRP